MRRPWQIWTAFAAALAIVGAAVGWLSVRALASERAEATGRQQAVVEENVRLALWRMDSLMAAFVAQESARPELAYRPFGRPADEDPVETPRHAPEPVASPLLVRPPQEVLLYFQRSAEGAWSSPQVPLGAERERAVAALVPAEQIKMHEARLAKVRELLQRPPLPDEPSVNGVLLSDGFIPRPEGPPFQSVRIGQRPSFPLPAAEDLPAQQPLSQQARSTNEFFNRSNYVVQNSNMAQAANSMFEMVEPPVIGTMLPRTAGGELFLMRTLSANGQTSLQGCWIDWETLRGELRAEIADLLPNSTLSLVDSPSEGEQTRLLASLPVRLDPGPVAAPAAETSPVWLALVLAWGAMLLAGVAVAVLLRGVVSLSERRADFVSAVTHELRTPLTTFRMYAEMLAEGMIPGEVARKRYLETLRVEADRLTHLVENVLAYARLERGGMGNRVAPIGIGELLEQSTGRLSERARQAGFELSVACVKAPEGVQVRCDPAAVEQILFNLVDNACKYAAAGMDKQIEISAQRADGRFELQVADHGPGIAAEQRRRLFQPFRKSADAAARSAPGVGLGLALSRRLARDMGGDLTYAPAPGTGARFVLSLPLG